MITFVSLYMQNSISIVSGWDIAFTLFCTLILEFVVVDIINWYHVMMRVNIYTVSVQPSSCFWLSVHQMLNIIKQCRILPTLKSNILLYAYDEMGHFILLCFLCVIKTILCIKQPFFLTVSSFLCWWQLSQWEKGSSSSAIGPDFLSWSIAR